MAPMDKRLDVVLEEVSLHQDTSRDASPAEKMRIIRNAGSRKSSFPWTLKKADSECSLVGEHKHGWKPVTLSPPVLILFALFSLVLVAIIEVLAQQSQREGGLALSPSADDFPTYVTFSYLFLPTIIAVIYSLFWSWVDLDAKRIQAWLEMSKDEGATAENSILLAYPYDFVGTVPIKAARRKHWPTFLAGTVMVLIFWLITPLQSAIMGTGPVFSSNPIRIVGTEGLKPVSEQVFLLDNSVLNEAYAITWLNQPYPAFTAPDFTIMPFNTPEKASTQSTNWTGISTKYWTELDCWPARMTPQLPLLKRTYDFDNGRGCNASGINPYGNGGGSFDWKMLYIGYQDSPWVDYSLASPTCSKNTSHQYLAIWSHHNRTTEYKPNEIRLEAQFCETNYYKQKVSATVRAKDLSPVKDLIKPLGPVESVTDSDFNITAFEYLLGAGVSSLEQLVDREYPFGRLLEQFPKTVGLNLTWPMSPMVGFAVGSQDINTMDDFNNQTRLADSYDITHKLMFSLALRQLLATETSNTLTEGTQELELIGVIVSRLYSAIVEGILGLVAILTLLLAWFCHKAPSSLTEDPASLGNLMSICRNSSMLLDGFAGKGCLTEDELSTALAEHSFRLVCGCRSRSGQMVIKVTGADREVTLNRSDTAMEDDLRSTRGHYIPVRPYVLRRDVGFVVTLIVTGALVFLIYLKQQEQAGNGLARPNASFEVLQILLNFLPTIFATLLEPFWVLCNRLLCMIQPFKDLFEGHKQAKGTINARYTSVPPQLVLWRAAGARHFLLVAVCSIALLSNLLAVGLSGLFDQLPVPTLSELEFQQTMLPRMSDQLIQELPTLAGKAVSFSYEEPFYVLMNNVSQGTSFPPWISDSHYFHPFSAIDNEQASPQQYTARTRGFGIEPICTSTERLKTRGLAPVLNITITRNGEAVPECPTTFQNPLLALNESIGRIGGGPSAAETVDTIVPGQNVQVCDTSLILGWSRSNQTLDVDGEMESLFIVCHPVFTTATFEVTVDPQGYVLKSERVTKADSTMGYDESTNNTDTMAVQLNHLLQSTMQAPWHNDTLSRDWMSYLLKIQPGNEGLLDPTADLPDPEKLVPIVDKVYRQLYALLLGLNSGAFVQRPKPIRIAGIQQQIETRIFIPLSAFIISTVVLGLNIVTAIIMYTHGVKFFLPRMPTTIGSTLAYVAPSRAVREYSPHPTGGPAKTYSFGRYVGEDGRAHVGIEQDPLVVPVQLSSLWDGDTLPRSFVKRTFTRKSTAKSGENWL